jgi:hypothetical protein
MNIIDKMELSHFNSKVGSDTPYTLQSNNQFFKQKQKLSEKY